MSHNMRTDAFADFRSVSLQTAVGGKQRVVAGPFGSNLTQIDYVPHGIPVIRGQNMNGNGRWLGGEFVYVSEEKAESLRSNLAYPGDIVVTQRGTVGEVSIVPTSNTFRVYVVSQSQMAISVDAEDAERDYIFYYLQSPLFGKYIRNSTNQTGIPHITLALLRSAPVLLPTRAEQRRIAEILRAWDEAFERSRALIDQKEQEFAAFAASMLTGHRRFRGSSVAWTRRFLGDVTREVGARNGRRYGRERVKAVNKAEGMIPMKDHVIAGDLSRYRIVPPCGFAYNPMRLNIGSIAMNEHGAEVLVSPDYVVFEALPGQLDPHFLNHFRRTSRWQRFMEIAGSGSVRVRIYYDDLAEMPLHLPPIDEQRRIAEFLNLARREIDLRRAELAALEKQKRGLMQKLLTGEWRVPPTESDVERAEQAAGPAVAAGVG
jgi:type I restriction enzyme, S subunit